MSSSGDSSGNGGSQSSSQPKGPPYAPQTWSLGGLPNQKVDIPITAVFLVLFIISAVTHMTIFQRNKKRGHKFLMSELLFGFSMARITACIVRIASLSLPHDVPLAIAANIFVAAGVVILYVVNIIFTQRIIRAAHPNVGWHKAFEAAVKIAIALVIIMIIMLITVIVQTFYTLNPRIRQTDREIQLLGLTYFAFASFLPIPVTIIGLLLPRNRPVDKFGEGKWRSKIRILLAASFLVSFGACYRCAVQYLPPRSIAKEPIYPSMHKAAFYIANFTIDITVLYMYALVRVDKRFHIPDGSRNGYGTTRLNGGLQHKVEDDESRPASSFVPGMRSSHGVDEKTISTIGSPQTNKSRFSGDASVMPNRPLQVHS